MKNQFYLLLAFCLFNLNLYAQCWQTLEAGALHTVAIKTDGTLWAWGSNIKGQLGDGTVDHFNEPVNIDTSTNWQEIATGALNSLALKSDGTLWAWGYNQDGQLGDGTNVDKYSPVQIGNATDWQNLNADYANVLAMKTDGTLWGWGWNNNGQIGDGTFENRNSPVQIGTDSDWQVMDLGLNFSLAIKTDGTLWGWGSNYWGQLGGSTNDGSNIPMLVNSDSTWQSIAAGNYHALGIKTDGSLWAWGRNNYGQLGIGNYNNKNIPTQIGPGSSWQSVATGTDFTLAIRSDGSLWAWGRNHYGQLGNGTTFDKINPTQIGTDTDWQTITAGQEFSVATKTDGTLWAWGDNYFGQFGNGTNTSQTSPIQIIACPVIVVEGATCAYANDINPLFGKAPNVPQVSTLYDNTGFSSTGDPKIGYDCWADGPALTQFIWYRFTGDGKTYRIRSIQCNSDNYNDDTQVAIYSGSCGNLAPVACNEDEDGAIEAFNFKVDLPTDLGTEYYLVVDGAHGLVGQYCLEVTNLTPNSTTQIGQSDIRLFPNPTTGTFHLNNVEADRVDVFDSIGRLVFTMATPGESIDLSGLPAGLYSLKIKEGKSIYSAKVLRE